MPTSGIRIDSAFLKACRLNTRLTQYEVARALEISPGYYQRLETGVDDTVSLSLLAVLEGYFGLDRNALEMVHPEERHLFVIPQQ
jgi:transcriptional regulator with XRE-family HTH domain